MARLRGRKGGGNAAFQGLTSFSNDLLKMIMQDRLARERGTEQAFLQADLADLGRTKQQGIDTAQTFLPKLVGGEVAPGSLPPNVLENLNLSPEQAVGIAPQNDTRPSIESLMKAKTQVDVPSFESMIADVAGRGAGIRDLSPLNQLGQLRTQRLGEIDRAQELEMDRGFATAKGNAYNTASGTNQAANEQFPIELQQKLQEGQQANTLSLDKETAMNPILASRAGMTTAATQAAQFSPEAIARRIDEFSQQEAIRASNRVPTDAQSRAAGLLAPLLISDAGIKEFEKKRIDLAPGAETFGDMALPTILQGRLPGSTAPQRQLLQHAHNFLNISSLILTGVTARPDEYARYTGTFIGKMGDDDTLRAQKAAARQAFIESVKQRAQTGQGGTLEEVMNEALQKVQGGAPGASSITPAYPGEPAPLADGIIKPTARQSLMDALENARSRGGR